MHQKMFPVLNLIISLLGTHPSNVIQKQVKAASMVKPTAGVSSFPISPTTFITMQVAQQR